jgi:chromosome segregation ATPase
MTTDKTIFGLRFQSNAELYPSKEELRDFLESPKKNGGRELQGDDVTAYRELLKNLQEFELHQQQGTSNQDFSRKMLYGVLSHSRFVNPALKSAVEQYKYLLHALLALDFKKPEAFIRSAEEDMSRLNQKNEDHAVRLARLRGMVAERKETLAALKSRWAALSEELNNIALYISDNLVKIERLCEAAIVVLVDFQIERKKEKQLIEDIKTHFKEHLKDSLHRGPITKQYLETVKKDVAVLSEEIPALLREDVYALTRLYEAIHDHTKRIAHEIDALMEKIKSKKNSSYENSRELFSQVEQVLVSLISDYRFELKTTEIRSETAYKNILMGKRQEVLAHLLELVQKERRAHRNRRTGEDRRRSKDSAYKASERRLEKNRRSRKDRRK